ncbi:MAG: hypothetical protein V3T77_09890 [Planctomycetota bacterium]
MGQRLTIFFLTCLLFCIPALSADPGQPAGRQSPSLSKNERLSRQLERRARLARERAERQAEHQLRRATHSFRRMQLSGTEVRANVNKLLELHWHNDLQLAQQDAQDLGKPILWIQALGDLEGNL